MLTLYAVLPFAKYDASIAKIMKNICLNHKAY